MASGSVQPFGYQGDPGTCLWCGRKLRYTRVIAGPDDRDNPTYQEHGPTYATVRAAKAGPWQDDLFDTTNCGYKFGQRQAQLGRRLQRRAEES